MKSKRLANAYLKNTDACFFIFALNDRDSFDNIKMWMDLFYENHKINEIPAILIGNKSDLESDIEDNIINEFAQNTNIEFIKTITLIDVFEYMNFLIKVRKLVLRILCFIIWPIFLLTFTRLLLNTPLWVVRLFVPDFYGVILASALIALFGGFVIQVKLISCKRFQR